MTKKPTKSKKTIAQHRKEKQMKRSIDQNIKTIEYKPSGFLPSGEFATKAGVSPSSITKARQAGAFPSNNMRWVKQKGIRKSLYIHWDSEGPKYIRTRPVEYWPDWFKDEQEIQELNIKTEATSEKPTGSGIGTPMGTVVVTDIHSAKLRKEMLAIKAKELELQKASNEVIEIHEVESLLIEIATNTRQSLLAIGPKAAPKLAASSSHRVCLEIIQGEVEKVLTGLSKLTAYAGEKTNG